MTEPTETAAELRSEIEKLARWHREDEKALTEMRATIQRLRTELAAAAPAGPAPATDRTAVVRAACEALYTAATGTGRMDEETAARHLAVLAGGQAAVDRAEVRDRIRRVLCEQDGKGYLWGTDMLEPDEYGDQAAAVLAVLPAPAQQTAVRAEIDWIIEHCPEHGCVELETEVCHCEIAERLRRLAGEAQQDPHSCSSCEGIDPDNCLLNPDREAQQDPAQDGEAGPHLTQSGNVRVDHLLRPAAVARSGQPDTDEETHRG